MKGTIFTIIALILTVGIAAQTVLTCRQVQETTDPSGNSTYANQDVQVRGIVTAFKRGSGFYLGDPLAVGADGQWSGLYVFDATLSNTVTLGDMMKLSGRIIELNGTTQLRLLTANVTESTGNPVPVTVIDAADLPYNSNTSEPWEGVMVMLSNQKISTVPNVFGQFQIMDETGTVAAMVDNELYNYPAAQFVANDVWYQLQGVVDFLTGDNFYRILPRSAADLIKEDSVAATKISIQSTNGSLNQVSAMNVLTTKLKPEWAINSFTMTLQINPSQAIFQGVEIDGTLCPTMPTYIQNGELITITYSGTTALTTLSDATLLKILVEPLAFGSTTISLQSFSFNDNALTILENGSLSVRIDDFTAYMAISTESESGAVNKKNIFDPTMNQKLNIEYGTKGGFLARAIIRIYDAQGRLVATPLHENFTGLTTVQQIGTLEWDGRDSNLKPLVPGTYYCHLEVSNRENGKRTKTVQPIVIKSRLK